LYTCFENGLRLLHPFMPFITEELWQRLPRRERDPESICITSYPRSNASRNNQDTEKVMKLSQDIIRAVRIIRTSFNLTKQRPKLFINLHSKEAHDSLNKEVQNIISRLSFSSETELLLNQNPPEGCAIEIVNEQCDACLLLKGLEAFDLSVECEKLEKKQETLRAQYNKEYKKTQTPDWEKVPFHVKEDHMNKLEGMKQELDNIEKALAGFKKLLAPTSNIAPPSNFAHLKALLEEDEKKKKLEEEAKHATDMKYLLGIGAAVLAIGVSYMFYRK